MNRNESGSPVEKRMISRRIRRFALGPALAVGLLFTLGCSDDSGGGAPAEPSCVEYAAAAAASPGTVISQLKATSLCDVAEVEFVATDVTDVFGVDLEITYDTAIVQYVGFTTDRSVLSADSATIAAIGREIVPGRVELGLTREAPDGIDVVGTRVLVTAFFASSLERGVGLLATQDQCLLGSEDPPVVKPGVTCAGGTFSVD